MIEVWRPLPEWEGLYSISNCGFVRGETEGYGGYKRGRILSGTKDKDGYLKVCLFSVNPRRKISVSIHKLVALTFIGNAVSPKNQINHINGNKSDNRIENLEYVTPAENIRHAIEVLNKQGRPKLGEMHHNSKLSDNDTRNIRLLISKGIKQKEIAIEYSVDASLISRIANNKLRRDSTIEI